MQLTDDLLSQAVMMVEDSRPTLAINLAGARQHWLEGMLRHEIGQCGGGWGRRAEQGGRWQQGDALTSARVVAGGSTGKAVPSRSRKEGSSRGAPAWVSEGAEATWVPVRIGGRRCQAPTRAPMCLTAPWALEGGGVPASPAELAPKGAGSQSQPQRLRVGMEVEQFLEAASDGARSPRLSPGTHYIRGVNNTRQPWHSSEGRKQYSLKPANPTEEGLASLHSVLFRKQPFLWRAALLYYTIERASRLSFSALFQDLEQYVQDAGVRWEYCVRAKRGQTDTSQPGTARGGAEPSGWGEQCCSGGHSSL